jgi:arylsulfatase A-like enzyme
VLALLTTGPAFAAERPNILFILADDLGYGDLGAFFQSSRATAAIRSQPWFFTPNLDTLAAEGMQLRRHYAPAPVCAPSRASLLLGVHQGHANIRDNQFDKALEDNHTLGTVLRQAGYATAMIGKYGLQGSGVPTAQAGHPLKRGFEYFYGMLAHLSGHYHYPKENGGTDNQGEPTGVHENYTNVTAGLDKCYSTDLFAARAKRWIMDHQATNAAQPFFVYLAFTAPHARLDVPTQAYPAGRGTNGGLQWLGSSGALINTASGTINSWIHPDYAAATYDHDSNASTAEIAWPDYAKRHATMIRRLDDAVADLVQTLKDLGCDTNTLLVFTSDNGPHNEAGSGGSYTQDPRFFRSFAGLDGLKRDTWEGGLRVPAIARWPAGITAGGTTLTASQFPDWLPTFAELAGVPAPARGDGVSLVPTLTGAGAQRDSTIYVEYYFSGTTPTYTEFQASRRGVSRNQEQVIHLAGFKGVRYNVTASTDNFQIFDTLNDPKEATNLAASSAYFTNLQQRMKDRVLQVRRPGGGVTRPYDSAPIPPVEVTTVPGLNWRAFEGSFPWVPDFTPMSATATGQCSGLDLSVRTRDDNIGLLYTGYLLVPTDGTYTLYLNTDGRAFLRLHEASVIDADFGYTNGTERSASVALKAGRQPLRLGYVRGTGGTPVLSLQWSGPAISKRTIPLTALVREGTPTPTAPTATPDAATTRQNTACMIDVLANDTDDGTPGPLRILSVSSPRAGTAATNAVAMIVYTPNPDFLGTDTFAYVVSDGANSATGSVSVAVGFFDGSYWFPFNQTSGLTTPEAGGVASATLMGFNNDPAQWVAGKFNRALSFDGAANYVSVDNFTGILGANSRTCAAWVKTTSSGQLPVIAWGPNTAGAKWALLIQSGNPRIEVTSGYRQGARLVNDGQWHHVACTFANDGTPDALDVKLFVDGTEETSYSASAARTISTTASGNVKIGSDIQGRFFVGQMDEPRIYNRALSAAEIAALASATNQSAAAWHRRYFGSATINWPADDDGDGGARLLEYALGTEPWLADRAQQSLAGEVVAGRLQVRFPRRVAGSSELVYTVQASRDLADWSSLTTSLVAATPLLEKDGFEQAVYQADAPLSQESAQYLRLQVTLP